MVNCRIFIGPVASSVFVRNCKDCEFTLACRQLRTRDVENVIFHLYSNVDPVIERSTALTFRPFNGAYPQLDAHFKKARLDPNDTHWRLIFDFNPNGGDGYGVPDPHFELIEEVADEWRVEVEGVAGAPTNPVPADAVATTESDGGSRMAGSATEKAPSKSKAKAQPKAAVEAAAAAKDKRSFVWAPNHGAVRVGTIVKVNFRRKEGQAPREAAFYQGKVTKVNADSKTFHVVYDDGDEEEKVKLEWIKVGLPADGSDGGVVVPAYGVGDVVEARVGKWKRQ